MQTAEKIGFVSILVISYLGYVSAEKKQFEVKQFIFY